MLKNIGRNNIYKIKTLNLALELKANSQTKILPFCLPFILIV